MDSKCVILHKVSKNWKTPFLLSQIVNLDNFCTLWFRTLFWSRALLDLLRKSADMGNLVLIFNCT